MTHSRPARRLAVFSLALLAVAAQPRPSHSGPDAPAPRAARPQQKARLTLEDTRRVGFSGSLPRIVRWLKSGQSYLIYDELPGQDAPQLVQVNARTGAQTALYDVARMQDALTSEPAIGGEAARVYARLPNYDFSDDETRVLLSIKNDLWVYTFASGALMRITATPDLPEQNPSFSPDAAQVGWVQNGDLYTVPLPSSPPNTSQTTVVQHPTPAPRRLTRDGSDLVLNGQLDWVYEEEVYGRGDTQGYRWSPDGRRIAFLRLDDTPVVPFTVLDHLPTRQNAEQWRYPKAGDPNPLATLHIAPSDGSAPPVPVDVSKYPAENRLIVRFAWTPDSRAVTFQVQPRNAKFLDLCRADAPTGKATSLLRETSEYWVEIRDNPRPLPDGSFLWASDRTGFQHLYRYAPDGKLLATLTRGPWDVRQILGVDPSGKWVYFTGARESHIAEGVYRVPVGGGKTERLSAQPGSHSPRFSPDFKLYVDTWSSATRPPQMRLHDGATGKEIRLIDPNARATEQIARYDFALPEMMTVKARDGFAMPARLLKPADFDPNKKYPVYMEVYGGPGLQTVRDSWSGSAWDQFLVQNGILVWKCDNRSASGQGVQSQYPIYKRVGESELADVEDSINYLKTLPYVDGERIGIGGWSFGGFLTEYALTHSNLFRCGIAGAGVSDWRLYDSIYTERYMDTPQANADGYNRTSPARAARNLSGHLLLVHGLMDDNVHAQNTLQLVYELERAGRDFDLLLYPSPRSRHGIGDPLLSRHLRQQEWRFLQRHLLGLPEDEANVKFSQHHPDIKLAR